MTDSTTEEKASDGGVDVGSSAEELFGPIDDEGVGSPVGGDREDDESSLEGDDTEDSGDDAEDGPGVEDRTAASVFGKLKADHDDETDDVLDDESPEEIIASADTPEPEPDIDEDLRADEGELADLLLTDRTEGEEFLWIDTGDDSAEPAAGAAGPDETAATGGDSEGDQPDDPADADLGIDDGDAEDLDGTSDGSAAGGDTDALGNDDVDGIDLEDPAATASHTDEPDSTSDETERSADAPDAGADDVPGLEEPTADSDDVVDSETLEEPADDSDHEPADGDRTPADDDSDDDTVADPDGDPVDDPADSPDRADDSDAPEDAADSESDAGTADPDTDTGTADTADTADPETDTGTSDPETDTGTSDVITDAPAAAADEVTSQTDSTPSHAADESDSSADTDDESSSRGFLARVLAKLNPF